VFTLSVLADRPRWNDYYSIIFPLYKWKKILSDYGIRIRITNNPADSILKDSDASIIISRVFEDGWQTIAKRNTKNETELISFLTDLKKSVDKLVWYDRCDSAGSTDFPIIQYVDIFIKNQIFRDCNYYTVNNGARSIRPWLADPHNLSEHLKLFFPCPPDQINKIKVGWNITHSDHRIFSFKYERVFSNYVFKHPKTFSPSSLRKFDFCLRGNLNYDNKNAISSHRYDAVSILRNLKGTKNIISDQRVAKRQFMRELSESKICVSPFGWGEICYRDFEAFIAGSLLIKPDVSNLITFPDLFIENKTYLAVSWGLDDLKEKVEDVLCNYPKYIDIARSGQMAFTKAITDGNAFVQHIKEILS
jgi:hypothetical protein